MSITEGWAFSISQFHKNSFEIYSVKMLKDIKNYI